jgi:hypothetical protein
MDTHKLERLFCSLLRAKVKKKCRSGDAMHPVSLWLKVFAQLPPRFIRAVYGS